MTERQRKKMTENRNREDEKCQDEDEWMKKENLKKKTNGVIVYISFPYRLAYCS